MYSRPNGSADNGQTSTGGFKGGTQFTDGQRLTTTYSFIYNFRGKDLLSGQSYTSLEKIGFQNSSNSFSDAATATNSLRDYADFLIANPNATLLICGNAYNTEYAEGHSTEVLSGGGVYLNGEVGTLQNLMVARASAVRDQLIKMGVPASQLTPAAGNNYHSSVGLSTTFVITIKPD